MSKEQAVVKKGKRVKCPQCSEQKHKDQMIYDERSKRWYCAKKCHPLLLKQREWQSKENEEWNELYEYVKELHGLPELTTGTIKRLQDLRAGFIFNRATKEMERAWKSGPSFSLQLEAYKLAEKDIRWRIANTLGGDNNTSATFYCITIMTDKLGEAFQRRKKHQREEVERKRRQDQLKQSGPMWDMPEYKPKASDKDISDFLN